jgi:hypothetical protein
MKIYQYTDYTNYVDSQVEANIKKLKNVWVEEKTIKQICEFRPNANAILCHGTRNAAEQKYFKKYYPDAQVLGTEISPTATQFPMTVQWDFHEINTEWIGMFDIVYSNSFDHAYDPVKMLTTWKTQLSPRGNIILEHGYSSADNNSRRSDPLEIYEDELIELFKKVDVELIHTFESTGIRGKCPCKLYVLKNI